MLTRADFRVEMTVPVRCTVVDASIAATKQVWSSCAKSMRCKGSDVNIKATGSGEIENRV